MHNLTAIAIKNAKPGTKLSDGGGLRLETDAKRNRTWVFRFTSPVTGRERFMGLGSADQVPLASAREAAAAARELIRRGVDPIDQRHAEKAAAKVEASREILFHIFAERYITTQESTWKSDAHRRQWRSTLATYAYPVIGARSIADVDTAAVLSILRPIWQTMPETASRIRGRVETILNAAKAEGLRSGENPAAWRGHLAQILPSKRKIRRTVNHPALPYEDAPAFWRSLVTDQTVASRALQFLILTAARLTEATEADAREIRRDRQIWVIPGARMKGGREHRVPLTDTALALASGDELLFRGPLSGRPLTDTALKHVILRHTKLPATTHGFRSTFRDWAGDCTDFPREIAEAALAHAIGNETEAAYRRGDALTKRRALMQAWANYLWQGSPTMLSDR